MDLELKGSLAIVTGASRGIGKAIALSLAKEGCNLAICARGDEALQASAEEMRAAGAEVLTSAIDVTSSASAERFTKEAMEQFGRIDVLVNNVGGNRRKDFDQTTDSDWEELIGLNFQSHARMSRLVIPTMKNQQSGVILFISSIFGREAGGGGLSLYNTTKTALISLSKIMALELASEGIRVNSIAPGSIRFPGGSWDRRCIDDPEGMEKFIAGNLPLGRFGTAAELANAVTFLASPKAALITGACINIDGGQSRSLI